MDEYSNDHQNSTNQKIHKICIPLISFSLIGMLDSIPFYFSLSFVLLFAAMVFYSVARFTNWRMFIVFVIALIMLGFWQLFVNPTKIYLSVSIFVLAWIGQFIGHKIEGKKPSFFRDIEFLLVGPVWVIFK